MRTRYARELNESSQDRLSDNQTMAAFDSQSRNPATTVVQAGQDAAQTSTCHECSLVLSRLDELTALIQRMHAQLDTDNSEEPEATNVSVQRAANRPRVTHTPRKWRLKGDVAAVLV